MADVPKSKERFCWHCGKSMGFVSNAYYDRRDTCGDRECDNEARNAERCEREEAHEQLDRDGGWDRW